MSPANLRPKEKVCIHDPSYESNMTFTDKGSVAQIGENQDLQSSGAIGFSSCSENSPTLQDQWLNNTCYPYPTPYQFPFPLSSTSDIQPMPGTNNIFMFQQNTPAISPLPLDSHHAHGFQVNNPVVTIQNAPSAEFELTKTPATTFQDHAFQEIAGLIDHHLNKMQIDGPREPQTQGETLNKQVRDPSCQSIHNRPFITIQNAPYPIPIPSTLNTPAMCLPPQDHTNTYQ